MKLFISSYQKNLKIILSVFALAFLCMSFFSIPTTEVFAESNFVFNNNLNIGSKLSPDVKELQTFLNNDGYNCGTLDGNFGSKTKQAVILFQTAKSLTPDGSVGPKTRASINGTSSVTAGCANGTNLFNTLTGKSCATVSVGCTSGALFNTLTGKSCASTTQPIVLPAGCTTTTMYSITTGLSCSMGLLPITGYGSSGSHSKADVSAPSAPTLSSKTAISITLTAMSGNEFSIDSGSTWQDSEVFSGLTPLTSYTFTARVKATSTTNASPSSVASASITTDALIMTGSVAITGTEKFGQVLTATPSLIYTPTTPSDVPTYQWKRDGSAIDSATESTYTLVEADIGSTITVTVTADGVHATGNVTSNATGTITLADGPSAPGAPTLSSKTATSITLTAISGNEFSIDSGSTWQDSNVFNGLTASTSYTFTARVKATSTTNASLSSVASASITTDVDGITVGEGGTYGTLAEALNAVNEGGLTGDVVLQIISSITEGQTAELFENGHNGTSSYTSVNIFPVYPNLTISGYIVGDLIRFDGTTNVHIDGRVNQSGSTSLTIENTNHDYGSTTVHYVNPTNTDVLNTNVIGRIETDGITSYTIGASSLDFLTLQEAFDYINLGAVSGDVVLKLIDNTTETGTAVLNSSNGGVNYTSVNIYPVYPNLTISGDIAGDLIQFNGTENVHIDGRVNQSGPTSLTIENTNSLDTSKAVNYINTTNTDVLNTIVIPLNDYLWLPKAGSTTHTVGGISGYYPSLMDAFYDINLGYIQGDIVLQIIENTDEAEPLIINASGTGGASWSSLTIYPTVSGLTISGNVDNSALITLDGADNVIIDGRVNRIGTTPSLTFVNTGTGNKTIEFTNTPENTNVIYSNGINESLVQWTPLAGFPLTTYTVGTTGANFPTLWDVFDFINTPNTNGDIVIQIIDNTIETIPAVLNSSNGGANYSSVTIYPTAPGLTISGNYVGYLITLLGADNVTTDGRVDRTGSSPSLTITNTNPNGGEITFLNSPRNSSVIYTNIQ